MNGRVDEGYRFEKHYIRGHRKMELGFGLAFLVMLAMALGHISQSEKMLLAAFVSMPPASSTDSKTLQR